MTASNIFEEHLDKNPANYVPLTPLSFLRRAAVVYSQHTAVIHGSRRYDWAECYRRCRRLASALHQRGIGPGDTVAVMAPNIPPTYEAHFGVPMTGAVLNALNTRLDAETIAFILQHGEAKILLTDTEFAPTIRSALQRLDRKIPVVDIDDPEGPGGERLGEIEYEDFLAGGDPDFDWRMPEDEWEAISLNYTSGTTGNPKGVVYHHRGAYLNAVGEIVVWSMGGQPTYLWTLPMFHCNGWCFPWTLAAMAGTNVCLRRISSKTIYDAIADHGVTHLSGAPIIMQMLLNATDEERRDFPQTVQMMTAAAPPPASVLARMQEQGIEVTHVYGLTEVYGPATVCAWHEDWDDLPIEEQAEKKSRQGVTYPVQEAVTVVDSDTLAEVPWDGETLGEVVMRGNITMKGYLKNPTETDKAFRGGWYHTGDLGVIHPDGYIQLKDRSKDIIISGGENISSIEIENVLYRHPAVAACGVVAIPDEKWGETPGAFVELNAGYEKTTAQDLIRHCRESMAHYKCPRHILFEAIPKTSTGKIQKFQLRERAKEIVREQGAK
ncbi:acyl-CoA synthetase [Ferruginivarius sediminum]|uniref:3-methylmercaptopropionyl-CoA ligase n=1 Tax=Ferruginivarius sediminum TaxID=2661937 RepID=A0A369TBK5_9PROT|nr:acyl-CoA synthetase [Ferruginivarius sediminum]RDD61775.1 acyl-CoA synthetase [Ferruginivarius sediminum]